MILNIWQALLVLALQAIIGLAHLIWAAVLIVTLVFIGDLFYWSTTMYIFSALGYADWFSPTPLCWRMSETRPLDKGLREHLPLYRESSAADTGTTTNATDTTYTKDIVDITPQAFTSRSSKWPPSIQLQSPTIECTDLACILYNMTIYKFSNLRPEQTIVNRDYSVIILVGCVTALALIESRVVFVLLREVLRVLRWLKGLK